MLAQSERNSLGFVRAGSCRVWLWAMMIIQRARLVFSCSAVSLAGTGEMGLNKSSVQNAEDCRVLRDRSDNKGCNNEEGILL